MFKRILPVLTVGLLCIASHPALATASTTPSQSLKKRAAKARAEFIAHLSSPEHLARLTPTQRHQQFLNLQAPFQGISIPDIGKYSGDAALLFEIRNQDRAEPKPVELANRYGAKLLLVRQSSNTAAQTSPQALYLHVVRPDAKAGTVTTQANGGELRAFGLTVAKHVKKLVAEAMTKVAAEDYAPPATKK
jgi:hypothetical protein